MTATFGVNFGHRGHRFPLSHGLLQMLSEVCHHRELNAAVS